MHPDYLLTREAAGQRILFAATPEDFSAVMADVLRSMSPGRIVVFTGNRSVEANGAWRAMVNAAGIAGREILRFSEIEEEPCTGTVEKMTEFLRQNPPSGVVAVGGGSVLDAAKAAYLMLQSNWELGSHFGVNQYSKAHPETVLKRIVAVPTTSGTGSEATGYSNIVDRAAGVKKLIAEEQIVPGTAIVVPHFTASMSRELTLATGCDALAHLIEGWLNIGADAAHPEANRWAECGVGALKRSFATVLDEPENIHARDNMALGAVLGGMVIRVKSTGLPHLCSFSWFGRIPHGMAVAMLLPAAWRYYLAEPAVATRTMEMAKFFPGSSPEEVVSSFRDYLTSLGVPESFDAYPGITPELLAATAVSGKENPMKLALAPRPVPLEKSEKVLSAILHEAAGIR